MTTYVKFNTNESSLTPLANLFKNLSKRLRKLLPILVIVGLLGVAGKMDFEDQICKNPNSKQCIEYKTQK